MNRAALLLCCIIAATFFSQEAHSSGTWGSMTPLGTPATASDAIATSDASTATKTSQLNFTGSTEDVLLGNGWGKVVNIQGIEEAPEDGSTYGRVNGGWGLIPGGGDMLSTNNLSDVADADAARENISAAAAADLGYTVVQSGTGDDSAAISTAISTAISIGTYKVFIPAGSWSLSTGITVTDTALSGHGLTITGGGQYHETQLTFTGAGYALSFTGTGTEGDSPVKYINIENLMITGGDANTTSSGGFYFDRCYIVKLRDCASTMWAATDAHALEARNIFNFSWSGGQLANNYGDTTSGGAVVVVGSKDSGAGDEWNTSNVSFFDTLIQNGYHGLEIIHDGNIFDNLSLTQVSFGKNAHHSIHIDNPNVSNVTVNNNHFESGGFAGTGNQLNADGTHCYIHGVKGLDISNNSMQDAIVYVDLLDVKGFSVTSNKIFESGGYVIDANTAISIAATNFNDSAGKVGANEIYTSQVETVYNFDSNSMVSLLGGGITRVANSTWDTYIFPHPENYQNTIINRAATLTGIPGYDNMYSPDGVNWMRVMVSSRYRGELSSAPTFTGSSGYFVKNLGPTVLSDGVGDYVVSGWIYADGAWYEDRSPVSDRVGAAGDITGVAAGTGLTGGGTSGDVTIDADTTYLQRRVTGTCSGAMITTINADGSVICRADENTTTPGGSDGQVQLNIGGVMSGDTGLTYDAATDSLTVVGTVNAASFSTNASDGERYLLIYNTDGYTGTALTTADEGAWYYDQTLGVYRYWTGSAWADWPGSTGTTDLGNTPAAASVTVTSSSGADTTLPAATTALAGVMSAADKTAVCTWSDTTPNPATMADGACVIDRSTGNTYRRDTNGLGYQVIAGAYTLF